MVTRETKVHKQQKTTYVLIKNVPIPYTRFVSLDAFTFFFYLWTFASIKKSPKVLAGDLGSITDPAPRFHIDDNLLIGYKCDAQYFKNYHNTLCK